GKTVPTQVRAGQLRLVREGSTIRYLVADGPEQEFREIHRDEFGGRDVEEIAFVVSSHGGATDVDARLVDIRIRSGRFAARPPDAVAGKSGPGQPFAAASAPRALTDVRAGDPVPVPETGATSAVSPSRFWLRMAVVLFILL